MFFQFKETETLLDFASKLISSIITTERVQLIAYDKSNQKFFKIIDGIKTFENTISRGLIGTAVKRKEILFTPKPTNDVNYNSNYDIETTLPLLTIPLIENEFILGVIQVITHF